MVYVFKLQTMKIDLWQFIITYYFYYFTLEIQYFYRQHNIEGTWDGNINHWNVSWQIDFWVSYKKLPFLAAGGLLSTRWGET